MGCRQPAGTGMLSSDESREARFDAAACGRYYRQIGKEPGVAGICVLYLYVCPHGRRSDFAGAGRYFVHKAFIAPARYA